jgi:uncharacterized phiE125 gp8 family phage protein
MLSQTVPPTAEPLTWADVREHLRVDSDEEEQLVSTALIPAARARCEGYTGRQLMGATYTLTLCGFPADGIIRIPRPPLKSVTSIAYLDTAGASQTLAASVYLVQTSKDEYAQRGIVTLKYGQIWPPTLQQADAVVVTFVAGYTATPATVVPAPLVGGMLKLITESFDNRAVQPEGPVPPEFDLFRVLSFD